MIAGDGRRGTAGDGGRAVTGSRWHPPGVPLLRPARARREWADTLAGPSRGLWLANDGGPQTHGVQ